MDNFLHLPPLYDFLNDVRYFVREKSKLVKVKIFDISTKFYFLYFVGKPD